ncbi:hypothetical protein JCGZ_04273 [Jatropha curcas]|uniref:EF-hand domain-containing protein n=1 Tax=Jatropha curcas TaxID=180498 RepID=A0A067KTQ6_JATCU|nr:hypothetical protein JCGZ_04273 [Jatropha curcas]
MDFLSHRGIDKNCPRTCVNKKGVGGVVHYSEEQLMNMFKSYDTDHDRRLSKQELKNLFNKLGSRFAGWRVWRALHHADANKDGYISEEEFSDLVKYILKCDYRI